jgi:hypothetical protein
LPCRTLDLSEKLAIGHIHSDVTAQGKRLARVASELNTG